MSRRLFNYMKFIFILILIIFSVFLIWNLLTKKYINKYKLYLLFGKKGVGKSTLLQKLAYYYSKRGYNVYCNEGDSTLSCAIPIDITQLPSLSASGFVKPNSVILCDEINLLWDNRDFKNFPKDLQRYFRLQRHYKHIFIGFSQTYDCDKKIRDLADYLIIIDRIARVWIKPKAYYKKVVIISPEDENSRETATMTDDFKPMGLFYNLTCQFNAFLPKWIKKHDSFK